MHLPLEGIAGTVSKIYHQILNVPYPLTEDEQLISSIKAAHSDWQRAEAMFHEVLDPDLIDYTIYDVMAAKTKYTYLLKLAKNKGLDW
ncbi:MAG: DUF2508 family protein [Eubacteriales bacterium]|nr:DUF2508 family protein [Eubacteriales bacterium]